jgi:AAA15 family ATPase/GTPase
MSSYTFCIADYHAIKEASIKLNGITVLAGLNGSGKSTLARWLHHTVKVLNDYDTMVNREAVGKFSSMMEFIRRFAYNLARPRGYYSRLYLLDRGVRVSNMSSFEATKEVFSQAIAVISDMMYENITADTHEDSLNRYSGYFNIKRDEWTNSEELIVKILSKLEEDYKEIEKECAEKKLARSIQDFSSKLFSLKSYDYEFEENAIKLDFLEDGESLLKPDTFVMPLNLRNVVYINTQYLGQSFSPNEDSELSELLINCRGEISDKAKALVRSVQDIISGDVTLSQKDSESTAMSAQQQHFMLVRRNGTRFDVRGAATGEISFSYILQLIKNGWIDDGTLLIIDEPESHLHPQWIVEYARILVLLQKKLGTKVLISSHNPDMISAVQSIAEAYDVLDKTIFYLTENSGDGTYTFKEQNDSIEQIFDTFNRAIDRINDFSDN